MKTPAWAAALVVLLSSGAAWGGDAEFDRIVKAIETHYGTQRVHVKFMGVANFAVKVAHPEGASGFKLALFEGLKDLKSRDDPDDWRDRDRFMDSLRGPNLHPMVCTHSRANREATYIFMGEASKSTRILIATFEPDQATVIEVKANIDTLLKSLEEPGHAGRTLGGEQ